MPIQGLTNRGEAFPVIGRIRKGAKKRTKKNLQSGKEYQIWGEELTYFRIDWAEGEELTAKNFEALYGKEPNGIRVLFPFDEIEKIWDAWKVAFTAGTMLGRSDGKFIKYLQDNKGNVLVREWIDVATGEKRPHPADDIAGFDFQNKPVKFENAGILKVMLYDMPRAAYLELVTGSDNDIINIDSQLNGFRVLNGGRLAGIPFILRRVPRMISTPGDKKDSPRVRRKKYLINIEVDPDWIMRKFGQLRTLALPNYVGEELPPAGALPPGEKIETDFDKDELEADAETVDEDPPAPEDPPFVDEPATPSPAPAAGPENDPLVEVLGDRSVNHAAKIWNCTTQQAAQDLAKAQKSKGLGRMVKWSVIVKVVAGEPV